MRVRLIFFLFLFCAAQPSGPESGSSCPCIPKNYIKKGTISKIILSPPRTKVHSPAPTHSISAQGLEIPSEKSLYKLLCQQLGTPLDEKGIEQIRQLVAKFYKDRGFFLTRVSVPANKTPYPDTLHLVISEMVVGKVDSS